MAPKKEQAALATGASIIAGLAAVDTNQQLQALSQLAAGSLTQVHAVAATQPQPALNLSHDTCLRASLLGQLQIRACHADWCILMSINLCVHAG